jgi:multidrug efflux system membrane fusion protein
MIKNILRSRWFYIAVIAVVLAVMFYPKSDDKNKGSAAVRVTVATAHREDVPVTVSLVGTVVAYESVAIKSRLDSQVNAVHFKDGDNVQEGQLLFELDDRALKAQISELEASVQKEKAQFANTRLQYDRARKLVETKTISQAQLDTAKANYEGQQAQLNSVEASLDSTKVMQSYARITAPISGRAGTINVTRGNNVKANDTQPLVVINQVRPIRAQFAIPQRYYDQIRTAMEAGDVEVKVKRTDAPEMVTGKLEYLDNTIDVSNGTFAARAIFTNEDEKLWPGMFVDVVLMLGIAKNSLVIPSVAVQGDEGKHFVFIADTASNKAVRRPVEISDNMGDLAIVAKGVEENEQVIVDGLMRVTDGGAITIASPEAPKPAEGNSAP